MWWRQLGTTKVGVDMYIPTEREEKKKVGPWASDM